MQIYIECPACGKKKIAAIFQKAAISIIGRLLPDCSTQSWTADKKCVCGKQLRATLSVSAINEAEQ